MRHRHNPERTLGKILDDQETSRSNSANVTGVAYHAKVVNNNDPENSKRIQVKIEGIDDATPVDKLPWCISPMPNFFFCLPQIGEHVIVFMMNPWNNNFTRIYFGPLQTENFGEQQYSGTMETFGFTTFDGKTK